MEEEPCHKSEMVSVEEEEHLSETLLSRRTSGREDCREVECPVCGELLLS